MFALQQIFPRARAGLLGRSLIVPVLLLALVACELPKGDTSTPKGLHYAVMQARHQGDTDTLWSLLHPSARDAFDQWVNAEKSAQRLVVVEFPKKVQTKALSVLTVHAFKNGKALFATLLGDKGGPLETWSALGAHVLSVEEAGDNATVHTWGGDDLRARRADGKWFAVLPKALATKLTASSKQAVANLEKIKTLVARLKH